ncbi:MAG: mercuric transporter MerT family protein [Mariprofundaceae bacterium]
MIEAAKNRDGQLPVFGAVLAGSLASACCIGPVVVVLLGFGSASVFIAMEPYRPVFAAITVALLVWAGWRHWQGREQCTASGCQPRKPLLLWLLGGLAILLLISPSLLPYFVS